MKHLETYMYVTFSFSRLSLSSHNSRHFNICLSEILIASLLQQISVFLKYLALATFSFYLLINGILPVPWAPSLHETLSQTAILYTTQQSFRTNN